MRPRKLRTPDELEARAGLYFEQCSNLEHPITLTGLIYALGLSSRQSLSHYEKREEFCDSVRRAKLRVEMAYEEKLHTRNPSGAIFALKNFGWGASSADLYTAGQGAQTFKIKLV